MSVSADLWSHQQATAQSVVSPLRPVLCVHWLFQTLPGLNRVWTGRDRGEWEAGGRKKEEAGDKYVKDHHPILCVSVNGRV